MSNKNRTSDLESSIRHAVREKLREAQPQLKIHRTVKDHLNCPKCRPKFEEAMLKRGYTKPDRCPNCGTELEESLLGGKHCPNCDRLEL